MSLQRPPTPFESRVYAALERIPSGRVTTYGDLAAALGCGSAQAVGQALGRNPFAPRVPCHRVIRGDLSAGGYTGEPHGPKVEQKLALLRGEGVVFDSCGRLADARQLFSLKSSAA